MFFLSTSDCTVVQESGQWDFMDYTVVPDQTDTPGWVIPIRGA